MRGRGHLRTLMVFIRYENVVRLLEFLGYRQDESPRGQWTASLGSVGARSQKLRRSEAAPQRQKAAVSRPGLSLLRTISTPTRFFGLIVIGHGSVWCGAELCFPRKIEGKVGHDTAHKVRSSDSSAGVLTSELWRG